MAARRYLWKIDKWNGGMADDLKTGGLGAFAYGDGFDIRDESGLLQVAAKPVKDSDATVDQLAKWIELNPTNNDMYAYAGDEIYKETGGTYSLARSLSGDSPAGQGLADFDGYLYYSRDTILGRFDYASTWTDSWQTGLSSSPWHPKLRFKNLLLVGHGRYVGTVDGVGTGTAQALVLPPGYHVRSMFRVGRYAAILCTRGSSISDSEEGMLFFWDGTSGTYNDFMPVPGNPHAGIALNNKIVVIAGVQPKILESQGGEFQVVQEIPRVAVGKTAEVWPGAIDVWRNLVHFGISDGTSTEVLRMVHNWGTKNGKFDLATGPVLNAEYPTSAGVKAGTGVQIGAIKKIGTTIRFAWKSASSYGIDEVDTTLFQDSATYRSLIFDRESAYEKIASKIVIELAGKLKTNEQVDVKITRTPYDDKDFADSANYITGSLTTANKTKLELSLEEKNVAMRSRDLALEITLGGSASTKPKAKRAWVEFTEDADVL